MHRPKFLFVLLVIVAACTLNFRALTSGREWRLEPTYVCEGETVEVSWEIEEVERGRQFCDNPDGGFSPRMTCTSDGACPVGAGCVDGLCIDPSLDPRTIDFGQGCYRSVTGIITRRLESGRSPARSEFTSQSGQRDFTVDETTTFRMTVGTGSETLGLGTKTATVVPNRDLPPVSRSVEFQIAQCQGLGNPITLDFREMPRPLTGSPSVEIVEVLNDSRIPVSVATLSSRRGPEILSALGTTRNLNGPIPAIWTVTPLINTEEVTCREGVLTGGDGITLPAPVLTIRLSCSID